MKTLLILYTEYAPYLHACLQKLSNTYQYSIHVVRYPIDKNAPFVFLPSENITFYDKIELNSQTLWELYKQLNPSCVLVAGWIDKDYNRLLPKIKKEGKIVIAAIDNLWIGTPKQRIFATVGKAFIDKRFTHVWVPGIYQFDYMRKIGIPLNRILTNYYSADSDLFLSRYKPLDVIPKKFIYVGRLLEIKGTLTLIKAIEIFNESLKSEWQFIIIGNGKLEQDVKELSQKFSNVLHKSFMQPDQLSAEIADGGVFVLPSNYDAWGAVVHEHAMLGFPLILSSMVGSRNYFVTPGYNGYIFESKKPDVLAHTFKKFVNLHPDSLLKMSKRSHDIGKTINTEGWAARLHETIQDHYRIS